MSISEKVKQFTEESEGVHCPPYPKPLSKDQVSFLVKMMVSEMVELSQTVMNLDEIKKLVNDAIYTDCNFNYKAPNSQSELIADQADAVVDTWYYALNTFAKHGTNLTPILELVHQANMNKRFPDGTFHRRQDGKVIKPPDWQPPDVNKEVKRQMVEGAWDI
jgi:predicted HAD superfamily Cof-like phosphohydrolase